MLITHEAANITTDTVCPFYKKARVATLSHHNMAEAIITLFNEMKGMLKSKEEENRKAELNNKTVAKRCYGQNSLRRRRIVLGIHD